MLLVGQVDSPFVRRVAVSMTLLGRSFERDRSSVFGNLTRGSVIKEVGASSVSNQKRPSSGPADRVHFRDNTAG
jgi:hypothetical protein